MDALEAQLLAHVAEAVKAAREGKGGEVRRLSYEVESLFEKLEELADSDPRCGTCGAQLPDDSLADECHGCLVAR